MNDSRPPDPLSPLLAQWKVMPPRDPAFRAGVWVRLGAGAPIGWGAFARRHVATVTGVLLLAVAVGALSGRGQARARSERESARLATSYVQGLDARSMTMP